MPTAEAPSVIISPEIGDQLAYFEARLTVDAQALGALAVATRAEVPDRLIVVHPDELATGLDIANVPAPSGSTLTICRYRSNYTTDHRLSGHIVHEGGRRDVPAERPKDLVVVAPNLLPGTLTKNAATGLRNHPRLNEVVRHDERTRELLDRRVVLPGVSLGMATVIGGGWADFEGVPYLGWAPRVGTALFGLSVAAVVYTRNASPRRAPMPDLTNASPPLFPVNRATDEPLF